MTLSQGDSAPDFTLYTDDTEAWTLSEQLRNGPVALLFFPGAFTSVCTSELNTVNNSLGDYTGGGGDVVGISTDSPFALAEFKKANGFSFPLLSDHDGAVSEQYGAKYDHDFTPMKLDRISKRAAFVINAAGEVVYAEVMENAGEQPDLKKVAEVLESA